MSPPSSPKAVNAGRRLSPVCSVPEPLHLLCLLPGCFPRESQGSRVSLSKTADPLAFSLEHTSLPNSAFSIIVQCIPLGKVQSVVFYVDFSISSALKIVPGSSTNLCWLNEWRCGLCLFHLCPLHHGMCPLLEWKVKVAQLCLTLCHPMHCRNSSGQNTEVGSLSLLQGILPTQGSNQGLPHCRQIFYQLSYQGPPLYMIICGIIGLTQSLYQNNS